MKKMNLLALLATFCVAGTSLFAGVDWSGFKSTESAPPAIPARRSSLPKKTAAFKQELRKVATEKSEHMADARQQREEYFDLAVKIFRILGKRLTNQTRKHIRQTVEHHTNPEILHGAPWMGDDEIYSFADLLEKMRQLTNNLQDDPKLKKDYKLQVKSIKSLEKEHEKLHARYNTVANKTDSRSEFDADYSFYDPLDFASLQDIKNSNAYRRKHNNDLKTFIEIELRGKEKKGVTSRIKGMFKKKPKTAKKTDADKMTTYISAMGNLFKRDIPVENEILDLLAAQAKTADEKERILITQTGGEMAGEDFAAKEQDMRALSIADAKSELDEYKQEVANKKRFLAQLKANPNLVRELLVLWRDMEELADEVERLQDKIDPESTRWELFELSYESMEKARTSLQGARNHIAHLRSMS